MFRWLWELFLSLFTANERRKAESPASFTRKSPLPERPASPSREPLYQARAFNTEALLDDARDDVCPAAPGSRKPTQTQLHVILAQAGAQAVVAGAGSGKSTSLVTRLLLMNKHLQIPIQQLSVFTFTRNSRFDFIKKLVAEAAKWQVPLAEDAASKRVRTFHSKVLELSRSALPAGMQLFDMLGKLPKPTPGSKAETTFLKEQEKLADELENPFDNTRSRDQLELLRHAYDLAYAGRPEFRQAISELAP